MKNIKFALIALVALFVPAFAEQRDPIQYHIDLDEKQPDLRVTHPIQWVYYDGNRNKGTYIDIKEDVMAKRPILDKDGKEIKRIYGDMDIIGATISKPTNGGYDYNPITKLWSGTLTYILPENDDPAHFSYNSAKSTFDFSKKPTELERNNIDGSKVIFARLYWAGGISSWYGAKAQDVNGLRKDYFSEIRGFNTIKFLTPDGKQHSINAKPQDVFWYGSYSWVNTSAKGGMYFMYQASADVTDIVKKSLTKDQRTFIAGNIKSSTSAPGWIETYRNGNWSGRYDNRPNLAPHYGGWALIIVYDFGENESKNIKPKSINIYDGLKVLDPNSSCPNLVSKRTLLHFTDFYTPPSGPVNSTLAVLTFGAKKETGSEDIQVWRDNKYESVTSNGNMSGQQLNSTITKFGTNINSGRTYNNQMDLDIFDISGKIGNAETEAWVNIIAKSEWKLDKDKEDAGYKLSSKNCESWKYGVPPARIYAERANVGLVAFSTELYSPKVCYEETLFTKNQAGVFEEVSTDSKSHTQVNKDSILRTQVAIKNLGNESAEKLTVTASLDPKSSEYEPQTTHMVLSAKSDATFTVGALNPDNTNFQKSSKNLLTFAVGKDAGRIGESNQGGTIDLTNQAFIQYDSKLKQTDDFNATIYRASFTNSALNLSFEGKIERCQEKQYYLKVIDVPNINNFRAVNKNFTGDVKDSKNLYTQIANRNFDIKIVHFGEETTPGVVKPAKTNMDTKVKVDIRTSCEATGTSVYSKEVEFKKGKDGTAIVDLKGVLIEQAYSNLYVQLSFTDPITKAVKANCASDTFTVRPKEFKIYNTSTNSEITNRVLVGGKSYPAFGAWAMNDKNNKAEGYTTDFTGDNLDTKYIRFTPEIPATCTSVTSLPVTSLAAKFTDGAAKLQRYQEGATVIADKKDFAYYEVGKAKLVIFDNQWTITSHDQKNGDCIVNSHKNTETNGKVGCNIRSEFDFEFNPQDIHVENLRITGFNGGAMTYMSNEIAMSARATFDVKARLGDADHTVARMYTKGCYAKDAQFEIDIDTGIADLNDKDNIKTPNQSDAKSKILFFRDSTNTLVTKKTTTNDNSGVYNVSKDAFTNGEVKADVKFNFARKVTEPLDPFTVNSNIFTFKNVKEQSGSTTVANTYVKPLLADETTTQFYYGIVYAPYYEGPKVGFDADVYFGIYCKNCKKDTYTLAKGTSLPSISDWYLNGSHVDSSYGSVSEYKPKSATVSLTSKDISNGIQTLTLSDTQAETTEIEMVASKWLIYNKTDDLATSNKFSVTFFDRPKWGGRALNQKGEKITNPGKVLDTNEGDLNGYSEKPSKRSDW
ncbi:hypothetical protein H7R39_07230 [Campylobacter sp. Marseille-Q3452]|uniref:Uncharacterized protein n=1 Tax=Campylobacter massiliensis TaxID=2762557 RepID=A0A842JDB3_9BACT|nr:hypothetical protein [Campylobacter massiliensis]MBC2883044.1 hypothetical protein [Campylobacter massiliensis]